MATKKLTPAQLKDLQKYGITTTDVEEARTALIAQLKANDLEDMEEEPLDALLEYRSAFPAAAADEAPAKPKKKAAAPVEEEDDEPAAKPAKKKAPVVEEDDDEEELAKEVADKKPAKTVAKEKKAAKEGTDAPAAKGNGFDKANEEHVSLVTKLLRKLFGKEEYAIAPIANGVTVRFLGENAKVVIFKYSNVRIEGKVVTGDLNFKKVNSIDALKKLLPEEVAENHKLEKVSGRNYTRICAITVEQMTELFTDGEVLTAVLKQAKAIDTKMGNNRKKMEESLSAGEEEKKPAPKKAAKPPVEEDEDEAPAAKPKKKAVAATEEEDDEPVAKPKKKKAAAEEEE